MICSLLAIVKYTIYLGVLKNTSNANCVEKLFNSFGSVMPNIVFFISRKVE